MESTQNFALIVAAGRGLRMGAKTKKQYLDLDGCPVLTRTLMIFERNHCISEIVLVIPKEDAEYCISHIIAPFGFKKKIHIVSGGLERQDSVMNGLKFLQKSENVQKESIVLIHDGVRPFINQEIIENCIQKATEHDACIPGLQITDTVKRVSPDLTILNTVDRERLYHAQTPQSFKLELIVKAYEHALKQSFAATDDASVVEYFGGRVHIIKGSIFNIKITKPEDLVLGESILENIAVP